MNRVAHIVVISLSLGLLFGCSDDSATPGNASNNVTLDDIALNNKGVAQMGRYEYGPAEETFARLVADAPHWLEGRVNHAVATLNRQDEGDENQALAIATAVLAEDPDQIRALYLSGIIHLYLGAPEKAQEFLVRVTDMDSGDAYATYFLGQSHLQMGDYAQAAAWLVRAAEIDPYLRSAYWAGSQALRRLDRIEESTELLDGYQRFAPNPAARVAGFSYKKMGPKAEALSLISATEPLLSLPDGALFEEPRTIDKTVFGASLSVADINGDKTLDLFIGSPSVQVVMDGTATGFERVPDHPLATRVAGHPQLDVEKGDENGDEETSAMVWGDVNDDGLVDVIACSNDGSLLVLQSSEGWEQAQQLSASACRAGALFDADHDGDLDYYMTGPDGNELQSNNRDGTFRELAADMGLKGGAGRQVLIADLDADRDLDILVLNVEAPNDAWQNDRTWQYQAFPGLDDLRNTRLVAATKADVNADGHAEIYGLTDTGDLVSWQFDGNIWSRKDIQSGLNTLNAELQVADFDGDGQPELMHSHGGGFQIIDAFTGLALLTQEVAGLRTAMALTRNPARGPDVVTLDAGGVRLWPAGKGRYEFLAVSPTGRSESDQMRSNASGIGTLIKLRAGDRWSAVGFLDSHSGPGQSLMPVSIGLGGRDKADYIALSWSDGVSQTEVDLASGQLHEISEIQRQLASCPVIFAWDGESYSFVSDVLGVGGLGFFVSPGESAPPRPFEKYLLEPGMLVAKDGRYVIKLTEPMEENAYLDAATIDVYDLPAGWSLVMDERMGISGAAVTGRPITYRQALDPVSATDAQGADVLPLLQQADRRAPSPGDVDHRFIGLLAEDQVITVEFDQRIDRSDAVLVADGWVEYPYSQTVFAAWQADILYRSATLEARDSKGQWHTIISEFGYPAGMPRKMALPLPALPAGSTAIRLSSNMEIYWDRLQIVFEETLPDLARSTLAPVVARVAKTGFAQRTNGPQRVPLYDYSKRTPYWDTKYQRGFYTALGEAMPLLSQADGAMAIIGGGEEIHLEFESLLEPPAGTSRKYVLDFRGWAKDMDLYTEHGETVGPIPEPNHDFDPVRRDMLHARYNVRFQEGL